MRFDSYHPGLNLLFFASVIAFALWWSHPACVGIAYACAFAYSAKVCGARAVAFNLALVALAAVWTALFANFVHFGITDMGTTPVGNAYTLESLVYGAVWGIKIATVLMWASCVFALFTADKVVYLLGRVSPRLALLLAIALRAVPVVRDRAGRIGVARRCIGRGAGQGGAWRRVRNAAAQVSVLVSWSIERFVQTPDSMRSRGSALRGRTAYSIYRFDNRDRTIAVFLVLLITVCLAGASLDQMHILYDPAIVMNRVTAASFVFYAAYAALCLLPLILQVAKEAAFARQSARTGAM